VTNSQRPDEAGGEPGDRSGASRDGDLERRTRTLEAALSAKRAAEDAEKARIAGKDVSGYANALRLSSEFIAGIVVGASIGWFFDRFVGTAPWGLIVFLLLGFAAGVFNVLRSAGLMAENQSRKRGGSGPN
jgi:ATP synthase protein I